MPVIGGFSRSGIGGFSRSGTREFWWLFKPGSKCGLFTSHLEQLRTVKKGKAALRVYLGKSQSSSNLHLLGIWCL